MQQHMQRVSSLLLSSSWRSCWGYRSAALRYASVQSTSVEPTSGFFVPNSTVEELSNTRLEVLNHLGEPTFSSLGLGDGLWPSSLALNLLELLHVNCSVPWWLCAIGIGAGVRVLLMCPTILSRRAQDVSTSPEVAQINQLSRDLKSAQIMNNVAEVRRIAQQLQSDEMQPARAKTARALKLGAAALSLNIFGIFVLHLACIRAIYAATAVPVPGLDTGGILSLLDLTCTDATAAMPAAVTLVMLLNLMQFYRNSPSNDVLLAAKPLAYTLSPMMFFTFLLNCPGFLLFYFLSTGVFALAVNAAASVKS